MVMWCTTGLSVCSKLLVSVAHVPTFRLTPGFVLAAGRPTAVARCLSDLCIDIGLLTVWAHANGWSALRCLNTGSWC